MKILIVEDDFICRKFLLNHLGQYGNCDLAVNGREAVEAHRIALEVETPYDLICLDIMMPEMDGQEALKKIRNQEATHGIGGSDMVKIIVVSALNDPRNIMEAFIKGPCEAYLTKPFEPQELEDTLAVFGLIDCH